MTLRTDSASTKTKKKRRVSDFFTRAYTHKCTRTADLSAGCLENPNSFDRKVFGCIYIYIFKVGCDGGGESYDEIK